MSRVWSWVHIGLELLGGATLLALAIFYLSLWLAPESARRVQALSHPTASPVAVRLAKAISPTLVRLALTTEDDFARRVPVGVPRWTFHRAWPHVVRAIPAGTEIGCDVAMDRLGSMPLSKLAETIVEHERAKGRFAHWTVHAAAEQPVGTTVVP